MLETTCRAPRPKASAMPPKIMPNMIATMTTKKETLMPTWSIPITTAMLKMSICTERPRTSAYATSAELAAAVTRSFARGLKTPPASRSSQPATITMTAPRMLGLRRTRPIAAWSKVSFRTCSQLLSASIRSSSPADARLKRIRHLRSRSHESRRGPTHSWCILLTSAAKANGVACRTSCYRLVRLEGEAHPDGPERTTRLSRSIGEPRQRLGQGGIYEHAIGGGACGNGYRGVVAARSMLDEKRRGERSSFEGRAGLGERGHANTQDRRRPSVSRRRLRAAARRPVLADIHGRRPCPRRTRPSAVFLHERRVE